MEDLTLAEAFSILSEEVGARTDGMEWYLQPTDDPHLLVLSLLIPPRATLFSPREDAPLDVAFLSTLTPELFRLLVQKLIRRLERRLQG